MEYLNMQLFFISFIYLFLFVSYLHQVALVISYGIALRRPFDPIGNKKFYSLNTKIYNSYETFEIGVVKKETKKKNC